MILCITGRYFDVVLMNIDAPILHGRDNLRFVQSHELHSLSHATAPIVYKHLNDEDDKKVKLVMSPDRSSTFIPPIQWSVKDELAVFRLALNDSGGQYRIPLTIKKTCPASVEVRGRTSNSTKKAEKNQTFLSTFVALETTRSSTSPSKVERKKGTKKVPVILDPLLTTMKVSPSSRQRGIDPSIIDSFVFTS